MKSTLQNLKNKYQTIWCHAERFRPSKSSTLTLYAPSVVRRHQEWLEWISGRVISWNEMCLLDRCSGVEFFKKWFLRVSRASKLRANLSPKIQPSPSKVPREHYKRTLMWERKPLRLTTLHIYQTINRLVDHQGRANTNRNKSPDESYHVLLDGTESHQTLGHEQDTPTPSPARANYEVKKLLPLKQNPTSLSIYFKHGEFNGRSLSKNLVTHQNLWFVAYELSLVKHLQIIKVIHARRWHKIWCTIIASISNQHRDVHVRSHHNSGPH